MQLLEHLGTEETNTGFRNVKTGQLDDMCISPNVLNWPTNCAFTVNGVFGGEITNFHVAGAVGAGDKVGGLWRDTDRGTSIHNEWNMLHLYLEGKERVATSITT